MFVITWCLQKLIQLLFVEQYTIVCRLLQQSNVIYQIKVRSGFPRRENLIKPFYKILPIAIGTLTMLVPLFFFYKTLFGLVRDVCFFRRANKYWTSCAEKGKKSIKVVDFQLENNIQYSSKHNPSSGKNEGKKSYPVMNIILTMKRLCRYLRSLFPKSLFDK